VQLTLERISPWTEIRIIRVSPVIKEYVRIIGRFACPITLASGSSHSRSSGAFSENLLSEYRLALFEWLKVGKPGKVGVPRLEDDPDLG